MTPATSPILRGDLNEPCKRFVKHREKSLLKKCRSLWAFTNPNGVTYLFGLFVSDRTEKTIVTIAHFENSIHQFIPTH